MSFWIPSLSTQNRLIHWLTLFICETSTSTIGGDAAVAVSFVSAIDCFESISEGGDSNEICSSIWSEPSSARSAVGVTNMFESIV